MKQHTIFKSVAGSRLYGTNVADSDTDYKSIRLPTTQELLLGRTKDIINTSTGGKTSTNGMNDIDNETFTLQRYLELASKMQPIAVELLFSKNITIDGTNIWKQVVANKDKLLNSNSDPWTGYCRAQANKYSVRGKRLEHFTMVMDLLSNPSVKTYASVTTDLGLMDRLRELSDRIPEITIIDKMNPGNVMIPTLCVHGRQASLTCTLKEVQHIMGRPLKDAGKRTQEACEAGGADWKALYHAVRIAQQGIDLFSKGELVFPASNANLLLAIRRGYYSLDYVMDHFDGQMDKLEDAVRTTTLPDKPDNEWIDEFVYETHLRIIFSGL